MQHESANKVKYIDPNKGDLIMFFWKSQSKILFKISWVDWEKYGKNQDKKRRKHKHISVLKVL